MLWLSTTCHMHISTIWSSAEALAQIQPIEYLLGKELATMEEKEQIELAS